MRLQRIATISIVAALLAFASCDDSPARRENPAAPAPRASESSSTSTPTGAAGSQPASSATSAASHPATASAAHAATSAARSANTLEALSNGGKYFVRITPRPWPIPLNELFELEVSAAAANQRDVALTAIELRVDAAMPEHQHGMATEPKLRRSGNSFVVEGLQFHMSGWWELYVDITVGGVTERAQFRIELE